MDDLVPWWKIDMGDAESEAARDAVSAGHLSQGPLISELEHRLAESLGVPFVLTTTSGSTALATALIAAGVGSGDEVIVPNRTYIAAAHAAQLVGATVRLVDALTDSPNIDPAKIEEKITARTRAIIPVHLNGEACDMVAIQEIAARHGLIIIEDAAQALFSKHRNKYLGTFGQFGCFSLSITKFITSGQGGFVVTHEKSDYEHLQRMRFHGVSTSRDEDCSSTTRPSGASTGVINISIQRYPPSRWRSRQVISVVVEAVGDTLPSKSRSTISTSP